MISLPDFSKTFDYENNFYLSCDKTRLAKVMAHYDLYRMVVDLPGAIVECGVFKGASFARFAMFRSLLGNDFSRKLIGFDIFGAFPGTEFAADKAARDKFIAEAGEQSIDVDQLKQVLAHKGCDRNVELIKGDITQTVPEYLDKHPECKVSLLNLDTDIYEPAVVILEHFWPRIVPGGVLVLDDYGTFPGETKAVDDFFAGRKVTIRKFNYAMTPCFIVKD